MTYGAMSPTSLATAAESAVTCCGATWIAALRSSVFTSPRWVGSTTVTTSPSLPARAVRPERCRYALCSMGGSTWMTSSTSSTCTPRAATSVATSTLTVPAPNAARLRSRATCERLPCRSTAGMPWPVSCFASFFAWCLVRMKRMRRPVPDARVFTSAFFASRPSTSKTWWVISATGEFASSTECSTSFCRYFLTSLSTPLSRVAENSRRWPPRGVLSRMRVTTGRNPRSAMWSASSSTVISTASRFTKPCFMRSSRRPGQATTMSTPCFSAATWRCCETPPKIVVVTMPYASASGCMAAVICVASSRVGASTRPRGRPGRRRPPASDPPRRAIIGMEKARVLPEPVLPRPRTSRPFRVSGSVSTWMGKGSVMPLAVSAATRGAGTPRAPKEGVFDMEWCLSGASCRSSSAAGGRGTGDRRSGEGDGGHIRSPYDSVRAA
ncbi:hypothetical protein ACH61_01299 [Rathayibacter tanaceti]|uniref:Uncharacterized protein n=1 Tax=Rathayibacter tanaceti TaxID=1671680 RepID=A0A166I309_9MICO|nr:hypothetical protein ACH61_01299 [Rathayibacter tanaceti]